MIVAPGATDGEGDAISEAVGLGDCVAPGVPFVAVGCGAAVFLGAGTRTERHSKRQQRRRDGEHSNGGGDQQGVSGHGPGPPVAHRIAPRAGLPPRGATAGVLGVGADLKVCAQRMRAATWVVVAGCLADLKVCSYVGGGGGGCLADLKVCSCGFCARRPERPDGLRHGRVPYGPSGLRFLGIRWPGTRLVAVAADLQVCQSDGKEDAMLRYRRSPRLSHFDYAGNYAYFLTMVTRRRRRVFSDHAVAQQVAVAMERAARKHRFEVHAYCFMPDHLHLLLSGESDSPLTEFVRQLKQVRASNTSTGTARSSGRSAITTVSSEVTKTLTRWRAISGGTR